MSDEELVAALAGGDLGALRELHARHAPWLRLRLGQRCADPDLVDQAIQDTFVAVWRSAGRYQPRAAVGAWIWGIGMRRLVDLLRSQRNRRHLPSALLQESPTSAPSAEELVLLGVQHGDLGAALADLAPELRAVVQVTVLDGLTAREAGRLLGLPVGTVKTRLRRAKAHLRQELS